MCALYHYLSTDNIATIILCLSFPCLLPLCLSLSPFTVSFHWYSCYHSTAWWFPDHGSHGTTTLPHANASIASTCSTITTTFFFVVSARSVWLWKTNNNQTRSQYGVLGCPRRTKCAGTPNAKVLSAKVLEHIHTLAPAHSHFWVLQGHPIAFYIHASQEDHERQERTRVFSSQFLLYVEVLVFVLIGFR